MIESSFKIKASLLIATCFSLPALANNFAVEINPLHYATSINEADYVRELVVDEPNLASQYNKEGLTPLHVAVKNESLTSIIVLIEEKINPNIKNSNGEPALIYAIKNNKISAARVLIKNGAKISAKDNEGKTAIEYIKEKGGKYLTLLENKKKSSVQKSTLKNVKSNTKENTKTLDLEKKLNKKIVENNTKLMLKLNQIEIILNQYEEKFSKIELENQELKTINTKQSETITNLETELENTDLYIVDIENKLNNQKAAFKIIEKKLLKIDTSLELLSKKTDKLSQTQMMQLYSNNKESTEEQLDLIGLNGTIIEEKPEFVELEFKNTKIIEDPIKEEELNLIR